MKKILITAIGGDIAQGTAMIVREYFPDWQIFGTDMETRHGGSLYADVFTTAPPASAPEYLTWLEDFVIRNEIDYCLPMSESELSVLAENGTNVIGHSKLIWAGATAIRIGCDKLHTADFIRSLDIPVPWTFAAESEPIPCFPCIFKLRRSAGSKAVFLCNSAEEVNFFRTRTPDAIVQEYLPDASSEVTCAVYRTREGQVSTLQMRRRLIGGLTGWAQVFRDKRIDIMCERIANALNVQGAINIQLRITPDGPRIFEINPRLSSTVLMRHAAGFTDVVWLLREMLGENIVPYLPEPGVTMVKTYGTAIMSDGRRAQDVL